MEFREWLAKQGEEEFRSFLRHCGHEADGPLDPCDVAWWLQEVRIEYDFDFSKFVASMMPEHSQALIDFTYYALGKDRTFLLDAIGSTLEDTKDQWEAYHQWLSFQDGHLEWTE